MLSTKIKEATKTAHQQLEVIVVKKLKAINNKRAYADFLKHFYAYFHAVEQQIAPFITTAILSDIKDRRNASYLKQDIEALGETATALPYAEAPMITNVQQALGALYVLEGSIMGGSIIVKMLEKQGIIEGISFFSGYGPATGEKWTTFIGVLNTYSTQPEQEKQAIQAANATFTNFEKVFNPTVTEKVME
ncbi:biliverdin-producing heme oxygenase [Olivibacter ginsenosidimutans]|uniref:Biliverdin-producing heme oxygenase n=1 Tax=Olivibacter ginsenosidimutans TaxID=1176537 RepID=A0ABP9AFG6_9SPHI